MRLAVCRRRLDTNSRLGDLLVTNQQAYRPPHSKASQVSVDNRPAFKHLQGTTFQIIPHRSRPSHWLVSH
jgi:hypothetical protein